MIIDIQKLQNYKNDYIPLKRTINFTVPVQIGFNSFFVCMANGGKIQAINPNSTLGHLVIRNENIETSINNNDSYMVPDGASIYLNTEGETDGDSIVSFDTIVELGASFDR